MENLMIEFDGNYVPKALCSVDRSGNVDDLDGCADYCDCEDGECSKCGIQQAFNRLGEFEKTGLEPSQIAEIDRLYAEKCKELNKFHSEREEALNEAYDLGYQSCLRYKDLKWSEGEELQRYREKIADGRMVELPCKVGDVVWVSPNRGKSFHTGKLFGKNENGSHLVFVNDIDRRLVEHPVSRAFYDWFWNVYTFEEAEQALKESEG